MRSSSSNRSAFEGLLRHGLTVFIASVALVSVAHAASTSGPPVFGEAAGDISGVVVSDIHYELGHGASIGAVTFRIDKPASDVGAFLIGSGLEAAGHCLVDELDVRCTFAAGVALSDVERLRVTAVG